MAIICASIIAPPGNGQKISHINTVYGQNINIPDKKEHIGHTESLRDDQELMTGKRQNRFIFTNPKNKKITVRFKTMGNLIIIPLVINDSDTLNFILDTGVHTPVIVELPYVNKLNLNNMRQVFLRGLGQGDTIPAFRSLNNILALDGLICHNQEIHMIISDNLHISEILGLPVHGLIGFDLFKDFVVEIDYTAGRLSFYKPHHYKSRIRPKDIIIPIHFVDNKPHLQTTIITDKNETLQVKLLVDTGASDALWLSTNSDSRIVVPDKNIESFLGRGLSGDMYGHKGRIKGIRLGHLELSDPIVSYPDSSQVSIIISGNRNGTLGAEILRRFFVTVNYPENYIKLRPTSRVKEQFNHNMSGLDISNPLPGLPVFTINNVRKDSPAYRAGLREEDQIMSVNRTSHNKLSLNDINFILQSRKDRKIMITVLRDGKSISASFTLQKEL